MPMGQTEEEARVPKVMVVDDEPDLVRLVQFRMEREGWDVVTATDGLSALSKAMEERPDIIFLDVMMPGMDGFEVLEQIRTRRGIHKTPRSEEHTSELQSRQYL